MLTPTREILGFRNFGVLPPVLFTPSLISFAVAPRAVAVEYTGVLFHLAIMFVVARMPARSDVLSGLVLPGEEKEPDGNQDAVGETAVPRPA